jgi:hypothetical protein
MYSTFNKSSLLERALLWTFVDFLRKDLRNTRMEYDFAVEGTMPASLRRESTKVQSKSLSKMQLKVVFEVKTSFGEVVPGFEVGHDGHVGTCEIVLRLQAS